MATQQAAHAAAGAAWASPGDLQQRGDELLLSYQSDSFQKAVSNGRYTHGQEHKALLNDMFEFIQDADLRVEQLSMLPAEADLVSEWGWWRWLRPPVRNSRAQQQPEEAAAAAQAVAAAAEEVVPAAATIMAAAVGVESGSRSIGVQRDRMPRNSDGIRRSFAGYTSATPISLGRGRFMLSLPMRLKGSVSESSGLADCAFRQWVCAVDEQQYAAASLQPEGASSGPGLHQAPSFGSDDYAAAFDETEMLPGVWTEEDLGSLPELAIGSGLSSFQGDTAPLHLCRDAAAEHSMPGIAPAAGSGTPPPAAAAAAANGAISSSPFHPTHDSVQLIKFQEKKKSNPNIGGAAAASSSHSAAPARASMQLLVDTSVGWCVLEPGREVKPRQTKRCRFGSSTALEGVGVAAGSAAPEARLGYQPPDAAAPAAAPVMPGTGLAGMCGAAAAAAAAAPRSAGTSMQSGAPSRSTAASEHLVSDADSLSQRIQRLQLQVLDPVEVVTVFHPNSDVDKASAILSDVVQLAQLKQVLLTQDIRDEFGRNVLHLAASRRAANQLGSLLQQQLLDLLLLSSPEDAELRQLSLTKLQLQGNNNGSTPLTVAAAAAGDQPEVFGRLLSVANADVLEARTKQGWTVLHTLASAAASNAAAGELAVEGTSERQPSGYLGCITATIRRLVAVAREAAACEHQVSAAEQQQLVSSWVVGVVGRAEPFSRHYKGQQVMAWAKDCAQQMLREPLSG